MRLLERRILEAWLREDTPPDAITHEVELAMAWALRNNRFRPSQSDDGNEWTVPLKIVVTDHLRQDGRFHVAIETWGVCE